MQTDRLARGISYFNQGIRNPWEMKELQTKLKNELSGKPHVAAILLDLITRIEAIEGKLLDGLCKKCKEIPSLCLCQD
jgi:hypothetical protein